MLNVRVSRFGLLLGSHDVLPPFLPLLLYFPGSASDLPPSVWMRPLGSKHQLMAQSSSKKDTNQLPQGSPFGVLTLSFVGESLQNSQNSPRSAGSHGMGLLAVLEPSFPPASPLGAGLPCVV